MVPDRVRSEVQGRAPQPLRIRRPRISRDRRPIWNGAVQIAVQSRCCTLQDSSNGELNSSKNPKLDH